MGMVFQASAVYKEMLHKPYAEKVDKIHVLYKEFMKIKDSLILQPKLEEIKTFARKNKDRELELEAELLFAYWLNQNRRITKPLEDIIETAKKEGIYHIVIRAYRVLADHYWAHIKNYERAFEMLTQNEKNLKKVSPESYPDYVTELNQAGISYYRFKDYEKVIEILSKAVKIPETPFNSLKLASAYNTLGLCYRKIGKYDVSDSILYKIFEFKEENTRNIWIPIAKGNIGHNYYSRGNFDKAVLFLTESYVDAEERQDLGLAAISLTALADIALQQGEFEKSWELIEKTLLYTKKSGSTHQLRLLYPIMSKWYGQAGMPALAAQYLDAAIVHNENYHKEFNALKILKAQQQLTAKEIDFNKLELKQEKTKNRVYIIAMAAIFTIFVLLSVIYRYNQNRKRLALKLNLQAVNFELETATQKLDAFKNSLLQKNKLIKQLERKAENKKHGLINHLRKQNMLVDKNWQEFQILFEQVYPNFMDQLKEKHASLSLSHIKYLCLAKLNLSDKEIAEILGISFNSIHVTKHRIRKKMAANLQDKQETEDEFTKLV